MKRAARAVYHRRCCPGYAAEDLDGLSLPGYHLHPLKGELKGFWSLRVTGNFRVIFRFEKKEPWDVDWSTTTRWRENDADA